MNFFPSKIFIGGLAKDTSSGKRQLCNDPHHHHHTVVRDNTPFSNIFAAEEHKLMEIDPHK
jgi:hypothetical protein